MAVIRNYRDEQLQLISPRLIKVPENTILLTGTGNTFEVRGPNTSPPTITITATPQGHLIGKTVTFTKSGTGHTLSVPYPNIATVTGDPDGSDIFTVTASITYQGLTYQSSYTINRIAAKNYDIYEVTTSTGSISYDPSLDVTTPSSINIASVISSNGLLYVPYAGRFTIHVSEDGGITWGSAVYTSSSNQSSYTYNLTGITETSTHVRIRLHVADESASDTNVLDTTTIPRIVFGYTGSGGGGFHGRSVHLDTGSASLVSIYDGSGYLASGYNSSNPVLCTAIPTGFLSTVYYKWALDNVTVSDWGTSNNTYTYYRKYESSNMPDTLRVVLGDGYSGSAEYASDYVTFIPLVDDGSIAAILSNNLHTISVDTSNVADYTNSGTYFWAYEGSNILTFNEVSNTYPDSGEAGKYNVDVTYTNIESGGSITGMNTTRGTIPDHTNLSANQATVTVVFRIRKLDDTTIAEEVRYQFLMKSSMQGNVTVIGSNDSNLFYGSSNLPYLVDFTDLIQTFWPGDQYSAPLTSGGMTFGYNFSGQSYTTLEGSSSYIGSQIYVALNDLPSGSLIIEDTSAGPTLVLGVACDPMDHPVLFGKEPYVAP